MHSDAPPGPVDVRPYMVVFGTLLALTLVTVGASYLNLSTASAVLLGLTIATMKAALVAMFFMHLKSERSMVYWPLGLTAVLFVALIAFTLWTEADHLTGTEFTGAFGGDAK